MSYNISDAFQNILAPANASLGDKFVYRKSVFMKIEFFFMYDAVCIHSWDGNYFPGQLVSTGELK